MVKREWVTAKRIKSSSSDRKKAEIEDGQSQKKSIELNIQLKCGVLSFFLLVIFHKIVSNLIFISYSLLSLRSSFPSSDMDLHMYTFVYRQLRIANMYYTERECHIVARSQNIELKNVGKWRSLTGPVQQQPATEAKKSYRTNERKWK